MNEAASGPTITGAIRTALQSLWAQKGPAAGLLVLYLFLGALILGLPYNLYAGVVEAILHARDYTAATAAGDNIPLALAIMAFLGLVGGGILMTLIGRLIALGRAQMLEGGPAALLRRALWVVWRLIEAMILVFLVYLLLYLLMTVTNWLYGLSDDVTWQGVAAILHIVFLIALISLSLLAIFAVVSLTIWAACQDRRVGLLKACRALGGMRIRLMISLFIIVAGATLLGLVAVELADLVLPDMTVLGSVILFTGLGLADFLTAYLWLSIGGQYSRASGLG
jgi:hypothetical protein